MIIVGATVIFCVTVCEEGPGSGFCLIQFSQEHVHRPTTTHLCSSLASIHHLDETAAEEGYDALHMVILIDFDAGTVEGCAEETCLSIAVDFDGEIDLKDRPFLFPWDHLFLDKRLLYPSSNHPY